MHRSSKHNQDGFGGVISHLAGAIPRQYVNKWTDGGRGGHHDGELVIEKNSRRPYSTSGLISQVR